jgi:hypothetical protein
MKINTALVAALITLANAHSDPRGVNAGTPKLMERQNANGRCGPKYGKCGTTSCCSIEGYCGLGPDYCSAPDCQFEYGPGTYHSVFIRAAASRDVACDANKVPAGNSTANIPRPKLGNVKYGGVGIYDCEVPGGIFGLCGNSFVFLLMAFLSDIAFTFDDGPSNYTSDLLDKLKKYNAKATFMISIYSSSRHFRSH